MLIATACSESNQAPTACFTISTTAQNVDAFDYNGATHFLIPREQTSIELYFDASTSTDIDSQDLRYTWDLGEGTRDGGSRVNKTYSYTHVGEYVTTVQLTVTDEQGNSQQSSREIRIAGTIQLASFTSIVSNAHLTSASSDLLGIYCNSTP